MKLIIAGSRSIKDPEHIIKALERWPHLKDCTEVVSGLAAGPDTLGIMWAICNGKKVVRFPAKWRENGNRAGIKRNNEMARYGTDLLAIWDGESRGTRHMIVTAKRHGLNVYIYNVDKEK